MEETCDCDDCLNTDEPCHMDCDVDNLCQGCYESIEAAKDREFDEKCALGYI